MHQRGSPYAYGSTPEFFELLVLRLLHALGYGRSLEDLQHVGKTGDGGIDGVISVDRLGLEKVYVQAKRWQNNVGRPEVQGFYGALAGRRATKSVIITTAAYTADAREFAEHMSDKIVLIDGTRLTQLMMDCGESSCRGDCALATQHSGKLRHPRHLEAVLVRPSPMRILGHRSTATFC